MAGVFNLLLFFILLSCMVVPNKEIANINLSYHNSAIFNSMKVNAISKDINMDELRGIFLLLSPNISRGMSTHSDILFISYIDRMETQNNDLF